MFVRCVVRAVGPRQRRQAAVVEPGAERAAVLVLEDEAPACAVEGDCQQLVDVRVADATERIYLRAKLAIICCNKGFRTQTSLDVM